MLSRIWRFFAAQPIRRFGGEIGVFADLKAGGCWRKPKKYYASSKIGSYQEYSAEAAYTLNRNNALAVNYRYRQNHGRDIEESVLSWRRFF
jgi:hypothetical protein